MKHVTMNDTELENHKKRIIIFFDQLGDKDYWKTLEEIARETRIDQEKVLTVINLSGDFARSSYRQKAGEPLFTTRRNFRDKAPFVDKIIGAFKNRID
jgi:hypothetical protein